jgi:phosphorylase kinase alpha/beta subunit
MTESMPSIGFEDLSVDAYLVKPFGLARAPHFCQDYDTLLSSEKRSGNFSEHLAARDALLRPGCEAQRCLFDPLLSVIFGRRFHTDRSRTDDLEAQLLHLNRALAQLTANLECPELYFLKGDIWVPNEHTPLAWTHANLAVAFQKLKESAEQRPRRGPGMSDVHVKADGSSRGRARKTRIGHV